MSWNRPGRLAGFFGSGLVDFGLYQVGFEFHRRSRFWLDPARSCRNLAGSVEIWLRFHRITSRSRRIWFGMLNILPETLKVLEIWSGLLNISPKMFKGIGDWFGLWNISPETLKVSVQVEFHRFWSAKPPTDPPGVGFDSSEPTFDSRSRWIGWWRVGLGQVGRVERVTGSPGHP